MLSCNLFKDDPEGMSYFMGFIHGDGTYSKNRDLLQVLSTDLQIIEDLKKRLNYGGKISTKYQNHERFKTCYLISLSNKNAKFFKENGFNRIKEEQSIFDFEKYDWFRPYDFLRGFLDSDGSVKIERGHHYCLVFLGCEKIIKSVREFLGFGTVSYVKKRGNRKQQLLTLRIPKKNTDWLVDKMWTNSTISLKRKTERLFSIIKDQKENPTNRELGISFDKKKKTRPWRVRTKEKSYWFATKEEAIEKRKEFIAE